MNRAAGTFRGVGTSLYQVFKEFQLLPFSIHWNCYKICLYWKNMNFVPTKVLGIPRARSNFEFQSFKVIWPLIKNRPLIVILSLFQIVFSDKFSEKGSASKFRVHIIKLLLTGFISYIYKWKLVSERNFFENQNFAIFSAAYLKIRIRSIFDQ